MNYYFRAFRNYAKYDGRATRKEYWWFILFHYIVVFALSVLDGFFGFYSTDIPLDFGCMTFIYILVSACPSICLQIRRLHDIGKSGCWWWAKRVPILSWYVFYLNCKASEPAINAYGSPASYIPTSVYEDDTQIGNSNKVRFCRKCGYELVNGSNFCSQCGTEIIENMEMKQNEVL